VGHRNARLTFHGRRLLVQRVREQHMPIAHVAKAMGVSRQCAHRWVARFDAEGEAGLHDRSSRPHRTPTRTPRRVERRVLAARREHRRGQDWLSAELDVPARTVGRILRRHHVPHLAVCDPMTGEVIRSSKSTAVRYERGRPGELVHIDVKKVGRIPDGGGWRAHSAVDDHSRFAYSEILGDETAASTAEFLERAAAAFAAAGIGRIETVMTDNAWNYTKSPRFADVLAELNAKHLCIKAHCPWQNGKVERFNRTLQSEWAYRHVFTTNEDRAAALAPWLEIYNTRRRHSALGGQPPVSRLASPT
jgi:transposase InsO family protein